jgi:glycosyltransferase involved in cell wall biosynthesis
VSATFDCAVAIPAHDALPDVIEAVASALAQTLPPAEIVVVDDASRDGTGDEVERRFGAAVRVVRATLGSAAAARNAAWRASRAPWVGFLDADDLWFPDKLAVAARRLAAAPGTGWFFSDGAFRDLDGATLPSWIALYGELEEGYVGSPLEQLMEVNFVLTSSVVVRRDLLESLGGFREDMSHAEDLDLWIGLARRSPAASAAQALVRYQHRPGGLTRQVESRLMGDVALFERLSADRTLPSGLRRRARHRVALARYKLAVAALREGRNADARRQLAGAWLFPERALPVALASAASVVPAALMRRLRRQHWATRPVVAPMGRHRRVALRVAAGAASGGHA